MTLERAKGLLDAGQPESAVSLLQSFISANPRSSSLDHAYLLLGAAFLDSKSPKEATVVLERLLADFPASAFANRARLALGRAHVELGRYDVAQKYYSDVRNLATEADTKREALRLSGEAAVIKGEFVRAIQAWLEDMTLAPETERAESRTRIRSVIKDRLDRKSLLRLRDLYPKGFPGDLALVRLIELSAAQGDDHETEQHVRLLLARFPENEYASTASELLSTLKDKLRTSQFMILALLPQSGRTAAFGAEAINGIRLALERGKQMQGVPTLGLVVANSEQTSRTELTELIAEYHPVAVIGPLLTRELQTLAGLSEQVEIPFITPGATLQDVRKLGSYLFSTTSSFSAQAERIAEYSVTRLEYKRFAVIYPETIYGKEMARLFSQAVSRQGGEIVAIEAFKDNETDYGRAIRRIKEEDLKQYGTVTTEDLPKGGTVLVYQPGFDAVFIPAAANQIPLIAAQLTFHDVKVPMLGTSTWHSTDLIRLGSRNVEGGIFVDGFVPESPDPTVRGFVETYQHRYQASPSNFAAQAYDATRLILEALRQGAGTGPAVREQLMKLTNLPSLAGPSAFGPGGTLERRVSVLQVRHGQFVQLD